MNLHYKKIFAWLLAVVLAVTSIPVSGRYSSDRILAGTTASSGNATTASGGAILLGDEEITSNISTPHTKDYFEIWTARIIRQ